jgi:hypothetical protein
MTLHTQVLSPGTFGSTRTFHRHGLLSL